MVMFLNVNVNIWSINLLIFNSVLIKNWKNFLHRVTFVMKSSLQVKGEPDCTCKAISTRFDWNSRFFIQYPSVFTSWKAQKQENIHSCGKTTLCDIWSDATDGKYFTIIVSFLLSLAHSRTVVQLLLGKTRIFRWDTKSQSGSNFELFSHRLCKS